MNRYASPEGKCSALAVTADGTTWLKCDSSLMCRSTDFGVSWTGSTVGLQILCYFQGPTISPHDPQQAMVAALDQGVFKTNDGGQTWKHTLKTKNGLSLVTSPSGQHVYLQCVKRTGLYAIADTKIRNPVFRASYFTFAF
jgi:photosystem II stability/assembly factor-like uncharacterized protein